VSVSSSIAGGNKYKIPFTYLYNNFIAPVSGTMTLTVIGNPTGAPVTLATYTLPTTSGSTTNTIYVEFTAGADITSITVAVSSPTYYDAGRVAAAELFINNFGDLQISQLEIVAPINYYDINTSINKIGGASPAVPANTASAAIKFESVSTSNPVNNSIAFIGSTIVSEQALANAAKYIYSLGNIGDNTWDGTAITGELQTGSLMLENTPWLDTKLRNLMVFADYPEQVRVKLEYTNDQEVSTVVTDQEFTNLPLRINKYVIDMNKSSWTHTIKLYITGVYAKLLGWGLKYSVERETE